MSAGPRTGRFPAGDPFRAAFYPLPGRALSGLFRKTHASAFRRFRIQTVHLCKQASHQTDRQCAGGATPPAPTRQRHLASVRRARRPAPASRLTCSACELYQRLQPGRAAAGNGHFAKTVEIPIRRPLQPGGVSRRAGDLPDVHLAPSRCRVFDISLQLMLIFCNKLIANLVLL